MLTILLLKGEQSQETKEGTPSDIHEPQSTSSTSVHLQELENQTLQQQTKFNEQKQERLRRALTKGGDVKSGNTAIDILRKATVHTSNIKMLQELYDDVQTYPSPLLSIDDIMQDKHLNDLYE